MWIWVGWHFAVGNKFCEFSHFKEISTKHWIIIYISFFMYQPTPAELKAKLPKLGRTLYMDPLYMQYILHILHILKTCPGNK